jgi:NAD(P)H-flavin reductase
MKTSVSHLMKAHRDAALEPRLYVVRRSRRETIDTVTVELVPEDRGEIPPFAAGQFDMLYVFGVGEIPISISGDPSNRSVLVHTIRDVGLVSKAVCRLKPADVVGVRGPFGRHWPIEEAEGKDVLVIAGGLGLAPLRSVVYHVLARRERYKKFILLCSAHMPANLLFVKELERWRARFDLEVGIIVGHADSAWCGNVGYVTKLIPHVAFEPQNAMAFICGPEVLMRFSARELEKRGMSTDQMYIAMERNMKCGVGLCGHCQLGSYFVCKDGSIFQYSQIQDLLVKEEI